MSVRRILLGAFWMIWLRVMDVTLVRIFLSMMVKPMERSTSCDGLSENRRAQTEEQDEYRQELY